MIPDRRSVFLGSQHLTQGLGGIAVVARLTTKVLARMNLDLRLQTLLDKADGEIEGVPWRTSKTGRVDFAAHCHLAALNCDRFVYDSVSTARAHPRFPPLNRPYLLWMHGVEVWYSLHKGRERALRGAEFVLVNSHATLDKFNELHRPPRDARVCWLATEADDAPSYGPSFEGPPTVLMLGTLDERGFYKGHAEVIACWDDVVSAVPDARLVIAGGGPGLEYTRRLAAASPAAANIKVTGFVPQESLADLWRHTHVLALPSRKEGFGLVYVEAMRHRLPVIASIHDAGAEVNVDGATGFNISLDKAGELADRLVTLLRSPDLARQYGQAGFERWRQHFRFTEFENRLRPLLVPFLG